MVELTKQTYPHGGGVFGAKPSKDLRSGFLAMWLGAGWWQYKYTIHAVHWNHLKTIYCMHMHKEKSDTGDWGPALLG